MMLVFRIGLKSSLLLSSPIVSEVLSGLPSPYFLPQTWFRFKASMRDLGVHCSVRLALEKIAAPARRIVNSSEPGVGAEFAHVEVGAGTAPDAGTGADV